MRSYLLSRTAYLCVSGGQLVILDLRSGKYLGLPPREAVELGAWVEGWPLGSMHNESLGGELPTALRRLTDHGLLTTDPSKGKSAEPVSKRLLDTSYMEDYSTVSVRIRVHHLVRMAWAVLVAACAKRYMRIDRIVGRAYRRKQRAVSKPADADREAELLRIFHSLRPLFYSPHNRCMFHCMALAEFLAGYGVYPDWVFGVRVAPFQAHCWLERDGTSLTDAPLNLDRMTPIMIV